MTRNGELDGADILDRQGEPDRSIEGDGRLLDARGESGLPNDLHRAADTDESGKDERREHRRHSIANLKLKTPVNGEVLNASHLGMAVQTNESLKVGRRYAFRMRDGGDVIRVPGKVEWCRLVRLLRIDENEFLPVFRLGVRLSGNIWSKPQVHYYP
jgi:hypothetical protein